MRLCYSRIPVIFVLAITAVFPHVARAYVPPRFAVSAELGFNVAGLDIDPEPAKDPDARTAVLVGANFEAQVGDLIYLQPEIFYTEKGAKFITTSTGAVAEDTLKYIQIPILLKAKFDVGRPEFMPYIFFGPNFGFLISATRDISGVESDITTQIAALDFAADLGIGAEYGVAEGVALFANARYSLGLTNILETPAPGSSVRTMGIQGIGGLKYSL